MDKADGASEGAYYRDFGMARLRALGLWRVPRSTIFLTQSIVISRSQSGLTQITFEWYLPH